MKQASKLMYEDNIGCIVILKEAGQIPTGIITERDIARTVGFAAEYSIFGDIPLSEIMGKPLITVRPNTSLKDAVVLMQQKDIRRLTRTAFTERIYMNALAYRARFKLIF
jgi:CBS domain-containing protein